VGRGPVEMGDGKGRGERNGKGRKSRRSVVANRTDRQTTMFAVKINGCVLVLQLDLIVDLLGSPSDEDIRTACEPAKAYVRSKGHIASKIAALYQLSPDCDDFIMHLMCQMLTFNPVFDHLYAQLFVIF